MQASGSKLLKKDVFGTTTRIESGAEMRIVRDATDAHPALRWLARWLLRREARAIKRLDTIPEVPDLLVLGRSHLERTYIQGEPLHRQRPENARFFRDAFRLLCRLHRLGVAHNDLAKEPNLLVQHCGHPAFVDFQLATCSTRKGRLFRLLAREDLRHLLKHKRSFFPDTLTERERRILDTPTLPSRIWMKTGKPVYLFVTRRLMGWKDREGAGDRV